MKAVLALVALAAALPAQGAARFAVVAGNNHGATGRARLWFAEGDADRFARALRELGDFSDDRVAVLRGKGAGDVRAALASMEERIRATRAAGERSLLVFYFSGHAGAQGIELGDERISYEELRKVIGDSSAEAKVAIVDACEAGGLTQVKGATAAPALDFALPEDAVRGTAFLASTAVGEAAQESAAIGGSFFTHHLEVALRGAGDADGDGQVTLGEAFRYTASRTVAESAGTEIGPQHPTYEMRMSGRGDVVLADLRRAEAKLRLPIDPDATYVLRGPRELIAEVPALGAPVTIALPAGHYVVERRSDAGRATGDLTLARGDVRDLPPLRPTRYDLARAKGGPQPLLAFAGAGILTVPLPNVGVAPMLRAGARQELGPVAARLHVDVARRDATDLSLRYTYSHVGAGLGVVTPLLLGRVLVEAGGEAGYGWTWQDLASGGTQSGGDASLSAVALASTRVGSVRFGLDLSAGAQAFKLNGEHVVRPVATAGLVVFFGVPR
jgi:Caspase domain